MAYMIPKIILLLSLVFQASTVDIKPKEVRVMVIGDIMMHSPVIYAGYNPETKEYNYDSMFKKVMPIFAEADIVIGNLETPLAGGVAKFSGYPRFNAPKEVAAALKKAGVDILTTANNHSMDQWDDGVIKTLEHLDEFQLLHTGTFRSAEEKEKPLILDVNGIKIGIIANTYGTNGLPVPKDKPYMVNLLDIQTIEHDVYLLKQNNVDYIMAMIHFGYEYHRLPSDEQEKWVETLYQSGVDFILGSHPHVVQPLRIFKGDKENSDKGVIFSLGNFLSNQRWDWKDYGVILDLTLEKEFNSKSIRIKNATVIPTYVVIGKENGRRSYSVIPLNNSDIDQKLLLNRDNLIEHVFQYQTEK